MKRVDYVAVLTMKRGKSTDSGFLSQRVVGEPIESNFEARHLLFCQTGCYVGARICFSLPQGGVVAPSQLIRCRVRQDREAQMNSEFVLKVFVRSKNKAECISFVIAPGLSLSDMALATALRSRKTLYAYCQEANGRQTPSQISN